MFFRNLVRPLALILLLSTSLYAQTAPTKAEQQEAQEAQKALEQKALTLLEEVITDAQSLKVAINRLRVQVTVADLLWPRNETRARALYEKSIKEFPELITGIDTSDPYYYNYVQGPIQLYNEILQSLIQHDPQMALDFLHQTHFPQSPNYDFSSYERQMESQIASQSVGVNPKLALQIAMESLDRGYSPNLVSLLTQLRDKDREGAAKLSNALIKKLLAENLLADGEAAGVAINLLMMSGQRESHGTVIPGKTMVSPNSTPLIDAAAYRDLMELVINAALKTSTAYNPSDWKERNIAQTLLTGLQSMMPDVEKIAPSRTAMLQRKIADFRKNLDPGSRFWQENQEVLQNGSVDDILGLASKVDAQMREQVYQQAAWKAIGTGDSERAKQIISENITNPVNRRQMLDEVERQIASKAVSEGKIEQARQVIERLRTNEERASLLTQLAGNLAGRGDKKLALQTLDEARSLVSNKAENYNQLQIQMQVARSYTPLDPARSFEMLESIINQLNELLSAAEVLNGFEQQFFKDGEIIWQGTNLSNTLLQVLSDLGQLAPADFDRAKDLAGGIQRPEVRLMAKLSLAKAALLTSQYQLNRPVNLPFTGSRRAIIITQ